MSTLTLDQAKQWLKHSEHPLAKTLFLRLKAIRSFEIPAPKRAAAAAYAIYCSLRSLLATLTRVFWWTPLFKGRLDGTGKNLYLFGGLPHISGPVHIRLGDNCRISGQTTISGRAAAPQAPLLEVGNNVDIGWMTTVAVGHRVEIGNNVRIAGRGFLAGYPGHPLDAGARAAGLPETDEQVGDIVLEDDVWLATGVSVMAGVCVGKGSVVAAGSVVTRDIPPGVLAAGVPARVIRRLDQAAVNAAEG